MLSTLLISARLCPTLLLILHQQDRRARDKTGHHEDMAAIPTPVTRPSLRKSHSVPSRAPVAVIRSEMIWRISMYSRHKEPG